MSNIDWKEIKAKPSETGNKTKKFKVNSIVDNYSPGAIWWNETNDYDKLNAVKQMVALLSTSLLSRMTRYRIETRLYGLVDQFAAIGRNYSQTNYNPTTVLPDRLTHNVVQSNIDTLVSKLSKIRPRARFLTNAGTFRAQKASKKLGYFSDGIFSENDIYSLSRHIVRDTLVMGDGVVHIFEENKRVRIERVLPYELLVDEQECVADANPSHMYRVKLIDRATLMSLYPDKAEAIANSSQMFLTNIHNLSSNTDQIEILEAFHMRTSEEAADGRHMLCIPDVMLLDETWNAPRFPFARLSWTQPFSGFWSQSLAEQLKSVQLEINKLLAIQQRSFHLAGSFKILLANGSQVPVESFNNKVGTIVKYAGIKPEYITPPILPPEFYRNIETLIQRSYQISGVSNLSATSQKPAGLNSGVALREYNDIESARFLEFSQDVERFFVDIAERCMDKAREIAEKNGGDYPVNRPNPKSLTKVNLKDIELEQKDYTITVFPASNLPNEPAGRLQAIDDLVQRGLIDPVEQRELLNMPDIEASNLLSTAQDEYLKEVFEDFMLEKKYQAPDPMDNLQLARKLCLQYYALAKSLNEEEDVLSLFRQYVADLNTLEAPKPVIPQLPQPELGSQVSPAEASQLALPAATAPLPGADSAIALGQVDAMRH